MDIFFNFNIGIYINEMAETINPYQLVDEINYPIHYYAYHKQLDKIKAIQPKILADIIQKPNLEGDTIAHISAKLSDMKFFMFGIKQCLRLVYIFNKLNRTPMYYLVGNTNFIKKICSKYSIEDHEIFPNFTLIKYYISLSDWPMVDFLLDRLKITNLTAGAMETLIVLDAEPEQKIKILSKMFDRKVDINSMIGNYFTPLIIATFEKQTSIVKFLLENGADPNYSGINKVFNNLSYSIVESNIEIVGLLLKHGADVESKDKFFRSPVHYLFMTSNQIPLSIRKSILNKTTNINAIDTDRNSILFYLLKTTNWRSYRKILSQFKLKIYLENKFGSKPIDFVKPIDLEDFYRMIYQSYVYQLNKNTKDGNFVDNIDNIISQKLKDKLDISSYKTYIMQKIIGGKSYPLKSKSKIKLLTAPKTNLNLFYPVSDNNVCFLYNILKKYPVLKIVSMPQKYLRMKIDKLYDMFVSDFTTDNTSDRVFREIIAKYIQYTPILINSLIIWQSKDKYFISPLIAEGIFDTMKKYPKTKYLLFRITIISKKTNHANFLLLDISEKIAERFEPLGQVPFINNSDLDIVLRNFFKDFYPSILYLSPRDIVNDISFQTFSMENLNIVFHDPLGFCLAWCYWYIESRISNSTTSPFDLTKKMIYQINKNEFLFKDYIRNYANYLDKKKNEIRTVAGIPSKYLYMSDFDIPDHLRQKYFEHIDYLFREIT